MGFTYQVFGLSVHSELPLPELLPTQAAPEVTIRIANAPVQAPVTPERSRWLVVNRQEAELYSRKGGRFEVRCGREVIIHPAPEADESLLRLHLLGVVMAVLLYQRGRLVLHASTVQIGDGAAAFMGESGWGKSTLAAALALRGHPLLADDLAVVEPGEAETALFPGFPRVKMMPEAAAALGLARESLTPLHADEPKLEWRAPDYHFSNPMNAGRRLPFQRIYLLAPGDEVTIQPVAPQQAVIELIRHSYPTRLMQPGDELHLRQCGQIANQVPVFRLHKPDRLDSLAELAAAAEAHALAEPVVEVESGGHLP